MSSAATDRGHAALERGQVTRSAAEVYEEFFVPALFREWAPRVAAAAAIRPGQKVLDVACGTGVLAREAASRVAPGGEVCGLDRNEGMLAVARREAPGIAWRQGLAEALPYDARRFDAVISQFGLMFFDDRRRALQEMLRVLRPGGRLAVAVWDRLETSPGYAAMTALLQRLFGERVAAGLRAPFVLGDPDELPGPVRGRRHARGSDRDRDRHRALSLDRGLGPHRRQGLDARRPDRRRPVPGAAPGGADRAQALHDRRWHRRLRLARPHRDRDQTLSAAPAQPQPSRRR